MIIRQFNFLTDYDDVCSWWEQQNWPNIPKESLSTTGFIVENKNDKVLAGWIYFTNSNIAWVEFFIANPSIKGNIRNDAFDLFFNKVNAFSKENNIKLLFTSVENKSLMMRLETNGFNPTDTGMTNYMKVL